MKITILRISAVKIYVSVIPVLLRYLTLGKMLGQLLREPTARNTVRLIN